ncbi:MAG TPA: transglutaminase family protein [Chthoniobacterales bacterium]|nr:transglutaminase family protein [Chthoniobacterales bacterium]
MLIRIGYDIALRLFNASPVVFLLRVHPSRQGRLVVPEHFQLEPHLPVDFYFDSFGNRCGRMNAPAEAIHFRNHAVVWDNGEPDLYAPEAEQELVRRMPPAALTFLLPSRYCEVDSELMALAWEKFGPIAPGWSRVQAICDFVHEHLRFGYQHARSNRTALEAFRERVGVCRDFTHLAITLCRCVNIPARYVTGYLGDIGVPPMEAPMDFSAWLEVYLGGRWYSFDARHNQSRIGRIVIARGRDAADVPITMVFANHRLEKFRVVTDEIRMNGKYHTEVERAIQPLPAPRSEILSLQQNGHTLPEVEGGDSSTIPAGQCRLIPWQT